jgi:CubicO group peptidase (beta-lactamase class C family)
MRPNEFKNLEPRKQALTLGNLLNMASGLDCDDNGDVDRPGNEGNLVWQRGSDFYKTILDLNMIRAPGDTAVYCSINPHLAGGVLSRITKRSLPDLMWDLLGEPMQMRSYFMGLTPPPRREGYMGGGMSFRPRDFMKLGQLYLNGGLWHGKRIVSQDWIKQTTAPQYPIYPPQKYGYLWWFTDYPYKGRTIQAYFASGNGGNEVIVIPDLDMVIATYGANYNEHAGWDMVLRLIPQYVLPAIEH